MKKKMFCTLLTVLLLSLTACGARGGDGITSSDFSSGEAQYSYGWDMDMGDYYEPPTGSEALGAALPANAKMIYTATLELETKEFDAASQSITQTVGELGGWFESRRLSQGGSSRYLTCVIRVPAENFSTLLDRVGEAAHVTDRREDSENVSEAYYDTEARLTTQRTKLERLQLLLSQAENMEDIISLESAISETELQIEYLTGTLRQYDSLIGYSTVTVNLWEVYRLTTDEEVPVTFAQRLGSALAAGLRNGIMNLEDFLIALARNWVSILIWAAIIAALVMLSRRRKRKKITFPSSPKPPQPPQPPENKE